MTFHRMTHTTRMAIEMTAVGYIIAVPGPQPDRLLDVGREALQDDVQIPPASPAAIIET